MAKWVRVAAEGDLALDKSLAVDVAGHGLLVARTAEGWFALRNLCSHQAQPLHGGAIRGGAIECPAHGARFRLKDGARLSMPAIVGVKTFPIRVANGAVEIDQDEVERLLGSPLD